MQFPIAVIRQGLIAITSCDTASLVRVLLAFFALGQKSRCLCYSNTNLTRSDQNGELMHFVEFWQAVTGSAPRWLYFDSKLIDYTEMSRVNQRGIYFVTIRRRGSAILRSLERRPTS